MDVNKKQHEHQFTWTVQSLVVNAYIHGLDEPRTVSQVDLVNHLGKTRMGQRGESKGRRFYLADYNDNSTKYRQQVLLPGLNDVCRPAGFVVVSEGYRENKCTLSVTCARGLLYQHTASATTTTKVKSDPNQEGSSRNVTVVRRNSKTSRPMKRKDRCRCRFQLFWDAQHRLWYFDEFGAGCLTHTGHGPLRPDDKGKDPWRAPVSNEAKDRAAARKQRNAAAGGGSSGGNVPAPASTSIAPMHDPMHDPTLEPVDARDAPMRTTEHKVDAHTFGLRDDEILPDGGLDTLVDEGADGIVTLHIKRAKLTKAEEELTKEQLENGQVYETLLPAFERLCRKITSVETYHFVEQTLHELERELTARDSNPTSVHEV